MKILLIGQWIFPLNTPRANRTWELAKGLAKEGHDVTIYALLGDRDYSEEERIYNLKIRNLGVSKFGLIDSQNYSKRTFFNRAVGRLVGQHNAFPGFEFYSMIRKCFIEEKDVDLLISIAHPHVIHWAVERYFDLLSPKCWIADCGDPFMGNAFYPPHRRYKKFEMAWCRRVDYIAVPIEEAKKGYYTEFSNKIRVIPQGFDNSNIKVAKYTPNNIPTFVFAGVTYPELRDPTRFLQYLYEHKIQCKFIVYSRSEIFKSYAGKLRGVLEVNDYVPREELIYEMSKSDFLLNISNGTGVQSPSKLIDYKLSGRPILTITSNFESAEIENFQNFINENYSADTVVDNVERYNIENIVRQFTSLYVEKVNNV